MTATISLLTRRTRRLLSAFVVGFVALLAISGHAAEKRATAEIPIDALMVELQAQSHSPIAQDMALAWWFPREYWEISMLGANPAQRKATLRIVGRYAILAVSQGPIIQTGAMSFASRDEVLKTLRVHRQRPNRKPVRLTPISHFEPNLRELLKGFEEGMRASVGPIAEGFRFFVFEDELSRSSDRLLSPYEPGSLVVSVAGEEDFTHTMRLETPLDALHVPRVCPNGKPAHVSWTFCPWSGKKLGSK